MLMAVALLIGLGLVGLATQTMDASVSVNKDDDMPALPGGEALDSVDDSDEQPDDNEPPAESDAPDNSTSDDDASGEATETEEATEADDDPSSLDANEFDLYQRCKALEITAEEVNEITSGATDDKQRAALLRKFVTALERRNYGAQETTKPQVTETKPPTEAQKRASRRFELAIKDEEWDEPQRKMIAAMNEHYGRLADEDAEKLERLENYVVNLYDQSEQSIVDDYVSSLGDDWKPLFGSGRTRTLAANSRERKSREALRKRARDLAETLAKSGSFISPEDTLNQAVAGLYPDHFKRAERQRAEAKRAKRNGATAARPVNKRPVSGRMNSDEQAMQFIDQLVSERNLLE